ncbi:MAG: chorismate-binding protein [Flavobacteriales bacterium]|jgi:isochorismate synthase|nr:chorismate-binding protein [Flavobacteriales bacterium]
MTGTQAVLDHCLRHGLTFVAFHSRGRTHLWVQQVPDLARVGPAELAEDQDVFVIAPFHSADGMVHVLRPDRHLVLNAETATAALEGCMGRTGPAPVPPVEWTADGHAAAITAAQALMATQELRKVVLSRAMHVPFPLHGAPALFCEALTTRPGAFVCLLNSPRHGTWLGASPERLLTGDRNAVLIDSLAGTMPAAEAPANALQWGAKERDEQELVTRTITRTLNELGVGRVLQLPTQVKRACSVAHLYTAITGQLGAVALHQVMRALHPTPAVCGTPTRAAAAFIAAHEPHDRELYTGYWGPWNFNGLTQLFVNLRCMRLFPDEACLYVGGGITAGSDPAAEWAETGHKARTWLEPIEAVRGRITSPPR